MNTVDHNNVVIFDDRGIPSIMCRFVRPKDTEEVPAVFKIGDKVADAIYISGTGLQMQRVRLASYDRRRVRISVKSEQRKRHNATR